MSATDREAILGRIRQALGETRGGAEGRAGHAYLRSTDLSREEIVEQFIERAADYRADVRRVPAGGERNAIAEALERRGAARIVVPADFPAAWIPEGGEVLRDDESSMTHAQLDTSHGVVTGCAVAVAQTGSIVLDGGEGQGRRALTLLPDYHLCVVRTEQIVGLMPEAISRLGDAVRERRQPVTFISGPSATSDIELNRVEGVHGPRTLDILVVG